MNIHQTIPRSDCIHFSKCGRYSLSYCRRYGASECGDCGLISRKHKNRITVDGAEKKVCTRCGRILPLSRFYDRTVQRNGKVYHLKASRCKMCMSEVQCERNRRKASNIKTNQI